MPHPQDDDKFVEMLAVAYLSGEGRKPGEVAEMLGISPVTVSRHLKDARRQYLRSQVTFLSESISRDLLDKVHQRVGRQALEDKLNHMAMRCGQTRKVSLRVFPCGPLSDDRVRMEKLADAAAPLIRTLLLRSESCGLTWGGMLESVIVALRKLPGPTRWREQEIPCIPLSGEPLGTESASCSSSNLAWELGRVINGPKYQAPSLAMVPAFVPYSFSADEKRGVRRLIEMVKAYDQIFGPQQNGNGEARRSRKAAPLVNELSMILTSVASSERPLGFGRGDLFNNMNISYPELKAILAAEVGGVCIPRQDLTRIQAEQLSTIRECWTGLNLQHLKACAARGASTVTGPPGVVVICGGAKRAKAVCELIRRGLVNHLIVDEVLAAELSATSG